MDSSKQLIIYIFMLSVLVTAYSNLLGSSCTKDNQCKVEDSRCINSVCTCKHYHAPLNNSKCLESKLLGKECVISEQCFLRVANSTCRDGYCHCSQGFIRFRKHTCLGPAQPGEVCYSDEHCQLYSKNSHCQFLIPKLFGKCTCHGPGLCDGEESTKPSAEVSTTEPPSETKPPEEEPIKESGTEANVWQGENPSDGDTAFSDPFYHQKEHLQPSEEQSTEEELTEETTERVESTTKADGFLRLETDPKPQNNSQVNIDWNNVKGVSLGFPCQTDIECQKNDNESRCINNVCDCISKSESCGSENTGCAPETFQCRSSGQCISWFFVCDGREDCADKSDEECEGPKCPRSSFQCAVSGKCVSLSVLCDGIKNCPHGEDEQFCSPQDRNATQGCPDNTFQCANGQCLPKHEFCNATPKCSDGSDEVSTFCGSPKNPKTSRHCPFQCSNGRCRSTAILCSGRDGCGDNSDETKCSVCRCPVVQ